MPQGIAKANLPTKTCPVCQRPFAWRKKWARDWESVIYCSDRCRKTGLKDVGNASCPVTGRSDGLKERTARMAGCRRVGQRDRKSDG